MITQNNGLHTDQSFKVNDFDTNRKPLCNFALVDNTNLHPIAHSSYQLLRSGSRPIGQIIILRGGCLYFNAFVLSNANIALSHILPNIGSLDYIFFADNVGLTLTSLTWLALKKTNAFSVITHYNGHYAVITVTQGHRFWYQSEDRMQLPISE